METINDVFTAFKAALQHLYEKNELNAITLLAVGNVCGFSNAKIKAFPESALSDTEAARLGEILRTLQTGKPVQYVLGTACFYGLNFKVNPSVLIPRPETEELVHWIIETVGSDQQAGGGPVISRDILDIGTGSGCIAISLKKNLSGANVSAIDISKDALRTAEENAALNQAGVNFIEADILNAATAQLPQLASPLYIIVSNPPYVTLQDKMMMHVNVTAFEPHTALFVPENDPLIFYRAIAGFAANTLQAGGYLFLEINESYGDEIVNLLKDKGLTAIELKKDLSGRDRMIKARYRYAPV